MTPYQQSIEAAKSWKEAVGAMWKRQRSMLYLSIAILILSLVGLAFIGVGIAALDDADNIATTPVIIGAFLLIAMIPLAIAVMVLMWVFYFDVRRWQNAAPESLKKSIKLLSIGVLITLISAVGAGSLSGFTTIPYFGAAAQMLSSFIQVAAYAGVIIEFIAIIKLRNAVDMPELARKGAKSIFINYIISFATAALSSIIAIAAVIGFAVNVAVEAAEGDDDFDNSDITTIWNTEDEVVEEYDETIDIEIDDDVFLAGIMETITEEAVNDADLAIFEEFEDNEGVIGALIFALVLAIVGSIVAMYYNYRGWWLIGKSELEVLPEPIEDETGEEVAYEEVETVEAVNEEQQNTDC